MAAVSSINLAASNANSGVKSNSQIRPTAGQSTTAASPAALKPDTVKLSMGASIKLMRHNGMSLANIAAQMGISVKDVNTYLGVTTAAAAPVQALPQTAPKSEVTAQAQPAAAATARAAEPDTKESLKP